MTHHSRALEELSPDGDLAARLASGGLPDDPKLRALLEFARDLTLHVGGGHADAVSRLISLGWDPQAIHDAVQVIGYFNYVNRIAEGLGVELEPRWHEGSGDPAPQP